MVTVFAFSNILSNITEFKAPVLLLYLRFRLSDSGFKIQDSKSGISHSIKIDEDKDKEEIRDED